MKKKNNTNNKNIYKNMEDSSEYEIEDLDLTLPKKENISRY